MLSTTPSDLPKRHQIMLQGIARQIVDREVLLISTWQASRIFLTRVSNSFRTIFEAGKEILGFTEADDVAVITTGQHINGEDATGLDVVAASVGLFLPISGKASAEVLEEGVTSIFRAVSKAEIDDIASSRLIRQGPNSMETKLFTENIDDAVAQGKATGADFNVIRLDVPNSVFDQLGKSNNIDVHIMTQRTIFVNPDQFNLLNNSVPGATVIR